MASSKLSALTALTSVGNDDLVYVADTADGGTTYASKKVTKANLFSGYATESYVSTQISNLIDGAPDALNTLNEIAAALNDDSSIATSLTTLIDANETHVDNMATLTGVAKDQTGLLPSLVLPSLMVQLSKKLSKIWRLLLKVHKLVLLLQTALRPKLVVLTLLTT